MASGDNDAKRSWLGALLAYLGLSPAGTAGPDDSGDGCVEHLRVSDEVLRARTELSGIRFWPSEAIEEQERPGGDAG